MHHKACDGGDKYALLLLLCRHIGLLFGKRPGTNLKISGFTCPHVIGFLGDLFFFPLWKADLKISGFTVKFFGCVWTVTESGRKSCGFKNIRIKKISGVDGASVAGFVPSK